jgi:predicted Fe-S protein YdhL (DUF1289 family)
MKTEITAYKTPQAHSKYNLVMNAKKFCQGCYREFDARIADEHI